MWGEKNQVCVDAILSAATLKLFNKECRCRNWTEISGAVIAWGWWTRAGSCLMRPVLVLLPFCCWGAHPLSVEDEGTVLWSGSSAVLLRGGVEITVWDLGHSSHLKRPVGIRICYPRIHLWGNGVFNDYGNQESKLQIGAWALQVA